MAHPEAEWPSQKESSFFIFFWNHYSSSSTCRHNFGRTFARKFSVGWLHVCVWGL